MKYVFGLIAFLICFCLVQAGEFRISRHQHFTISNASNCTCSAGCVCTSTATCANGSCVASEAVKPAPQVMPSPPVQYSTIVSEGGCANGQCSQTTSRGLFRRR